ncbi:MAG: glycosyltransferase family 4 protein [Rhodopila sp.]
MHRQVVLVADHYLPQPDRDAGSRTMMGFLRTLTGAGMVVKFWPHNRVYSPGYTEALQQMGIEVMYGPAMLSFDTWMRENGGQIDIVLLSRPEVAEDLLPLVRKYSAAPVVYYGHGLHFCRMRRQAETTQDDLLARSARLMEQRERKLWRQVDLSLYPSAEEADIARAVQPDCNFSAVVPYGFETFEPRQEPVESQEIIFVGGFAHAPNEDAAVWLTTQVLPLVRRQVPAAHLSIIGSSPTDRVRMLGDAPGVTMKANVSDHMLHEAYLNARVAVVPLRCGAGVKLKVVEALRQGLPLVTTPTGAQGLPGLWQIAAVETDPAAFAAAVVHLLTDDAAWTHQSAAQQDFAYLRFSNAAMAESLLAALRSATEGGRDRAAA